MVKRKGRITNCPCGSGRQYQECCALYLNNGDLAPDAETLMRSRYTAYVLHDENYLLATWHHSTRPQKLDLQPPHSNKWVGLEIVKAAHDQVEFIARYKIQGKAHRLHENSRFAYEQGRWYYVDGNFQTNT